jgi:hypothetical protein
MSDDVERLFAQDLDVLCAVEMGDSLLLLQSALLEFGASVAVSLEHRVKDSLMSLDLPVCHTDLRLSQEPFINDVALLIFIVPQLCAPGRLGHLQVIHCLCHPGLLRPRAHPTAQSATLCYTDIV